MAYTKKTWEDFPGTSTPITADDLNNIEDGVSTNNTSIGVLANLTTTAKTNLVGAINEVDADIALKNNIMSAGISSTITTVGTTYTKITLVETASVGSKLTISSGGIKIGAGITKVKVSAQMIGYNFTNTSVFFRIYKNGSNIINVAEIPEANTDKSYSITSQLITVAENDVLYLYYYDWNASGNNQIRVGTQLTVEAVA